jgi:PAS domain S-box-containing protein
VRAHVVHPDDAPRAAEEWRDCLAAGIALKTEVRLRRADGVYRWHAVHRVAAHDDTGAIVKWYSVAVDIEEQKRAQEALRNNEQNARLIADSIPGLICVYTSGGEFARINRQVAEYFGRSLDEVLSKRWGSRDAIHPDDQPHAYELFKQSIASGEPWEFESRLLRFDGVYRWFQSRGLPLRDSSGRIVNWYNVLNDIDERKRAEQALAASERNLKLIIDTMPAQAWSARVDGSIEFLNRLYTDYVGLSFEQLRQSDFQAAVHPDDLGELLNRWRAIRKSGRAGEAEARLRRHDGEYRWFLMRANPLRDEAGSIVKWYGVNTDIEDRKRAENSVAGEKQLLELIASGSPVRDVLNALCSWVEDLAPDCYCSAHPIDWSSATFEYGVAPSLPASYTAPIAGLPVSGEILPCGIAAHQNTQVIAEDIESDSRWFTSTVRAHVLEHGVRSVWSTPICSREGHILGTFCMLQRQPGTPSPHHQSVIAHATHIASIAIERSRTEAALRRSETLLAEGQRISSTGSFSWRVDINELKFSEELYRIFELDRTAPVTFERVFSRIHPEDMPALSERMKLIRTGRSPGEQEVRLRMLDGRIKYLRSVGQIMHHPDGRPEYLGAIQDITLRRVAEEATNKVRSELAHVTRVMSLGALTASIAHEVNQPLAGIATNASTCLRMLAADPPNVEGARETARRTIRDGNRAADVITRLRALFGKKPVATETVDLNEATREAVALVFSDLLRNQVIVRLELGDEPLLLTGDRVQLQQVILNLVRNASDAMSEVNDRPRNLLVKASREQDGSTRLSVRDAGVGLLGETAERLFDAFYTSKSDGMGIGLSVSRSIIESHGGKIWAEMNDGPGATFSFSIPQQTESAGDEDTPGVILMRPTAGAHDQTRNA